MGRNHISSACITCRDRKVRCDGNRPSCSRCEKKGANCRYVPGDDKRKLSLKSSVLLLCQRVNFLMLMLSENEVEVPTIEPDARKALEMLLEALHLPFSTLSDLKSPAEDQNHENEQDHTLSGVHDSRTNFPTPPFPQMQPDTFHSGSSLANELESQGEPLGTLFETASSNDFDLGDVQALWNDESPNWPWLSMGIPLALPSWPTDALPGTFISSIPLNPSETPGINEMEFQQCSLVFEADRLEDEKAPDEVVEDLSARLGGMQVAPDGQLRYYGATSTFYLQSKGSAHTHYPPNPRPGFERQELLARAHLGQEVSTDIENHLVELYFAWENANIPVVNREIFEIARSSWKAGNENPNYSEVLLNAMCALGAAFGSRFHPELVTYPRTLAEFFGQKAKILLEVELDSPTVAIAQALSILSQHEKAFMRDARGWLYSGMAMRIALDLGLHLDQSASVELGKMSRSDAESRRVTFWGVLVINNLWSFYLGRDFQLRNADVTVPKPEKSIELTVSDICEVANNIRQTLEPNTSRCISRQLVDLCEMVSPIAHVLYGSSQMSRQAIQQLSQEVTARLWDWEKALDSKLQVGFHGQTTAYPPQVLMLHMQYHQFLILIHRPWTSKTLLQPNPPQGPGYQHARAVCRESAVKIAKLLRMQEEHYTFRFLSIQTVHIISSAVPILIFAVISNTGPSTQANKGLGLHLGTCHRALDVLGQGFEHAKRVQKLLVDLEHRWQVLVRK